VAGRTPVAAVKAFAGPIQRALGCFAHGKVTVDSYDPDTEGVLKFNRADDIVLNGSARVSLSVTMRYRIVKMRSFSSPGKPWKVSTTGWIYTLKEQSGDLIADFHWHPAITPGIPFPHVHPANEVVKRHIPTGRVLVEDVLTLAVECGSAPTDGDKWKTIRSRNIENFAKGATWGVKQPGPIQKPSDLPN